jgi:hypothetical protein
MNDYWGHRQKWDRANWDKAKKCKETLKMLPGWECSACSYTGRMANRLRCDDIGNKGLEAKKRMEEDRKKEEEEKRKKEEEEKRKKKEEEERKEKAEEDAKRKTAAFAPTPGAAIPTD